MASSIYNHKHLQPAGAPTQGPSQQQHSQARLNDCFETIRQEFDVLIQEATLFRSQRDDFENKVTGQVNELNIIRQSLYDLENTHAQVRKQYEDTIRRLEQELAAYKAQIEGPPPVRQGIASLGQNDRRERDGDVRMDLGRGRDGPPRNAIRERDRDLRDRDRDMRVDREPLPPGLPPPPRGDATGREQLGIGRPHGLGGPPGEPVVGPGGEGMGALGLTPHATPVGLGVGAGPGGGTGGPGYGEGFYGRDARERGMERDRDPRDIREREMMRVESMRDVRGEPMRGVETQREREMMRVDREREMRDQRMLDRERDMSRDGRVPIHDRERERDRDRERDREQRDQRDVKRIKTERKTDGRPDQFSPSMNALSHHSHAPIALGPAPLPTGQLPPPPTGPLSGPSNTHGGPPPPSAPGATPKLPPPPTPTGAAGPGAPSSYQSPQQPHPPTPHVNGSAAGGPSAQTSGPGAPGPLQGPPPSGQQPPNQPPVQGPPPPPPSTGPQPPNPPAGAPPSAAPGGSSQALEPYREGQGVGVVGGPVVDLSLDPQSVPPELKKEGSDWFAIFSGSKEGKRKSIDVNLVHTFMHESVVCCVRFSHDGKFLATGCNRTAQIYDTKTGAKVCVLMDEDTSKTNDLYIRSVCFSPDGKYLATGAEDKQIRIWDIAKKRICNVFSGHQQEIYSLDFSKDGRLIVSGSGDKTARIWDMNDGSTSKILNINEPDNVDAGVTSVCISPDGRLVAAGSLDTIVRIWDVATGTLVERLRGHRDSVYSVAFTPDGRGLISGSLDKTLKYWDISGIRRSSQSQGANSVKPKEGEKGSQCIMNFTGHKDYVLSVAVSHDGKWVVSGSKDRGVQFWDANTAQVQCMLQGHKNSVISIDLSPVGMLLATGSGDWQARIWSYTAL